MNKIQIAKYIVTALTIVNAVCYLFLPLYKIPILGVECGGEMIEKVIAIGGFGNIASFLLPVIGAAGNVATIFLKNKATHILSAAFSLLPMMFFTYMIIIANNYLQPIDGAEISIIGLLGAGLWGGLTASTLAMVGTFAVVAMELKKYNPNVNH